MTKNTNEIQPPLGSRMIPTSCNLIDVGRFFRPLSFILLGILVVFSYYRDCSWTTGSSSSMKNGTSDKMIETNSTIKANNDNTTNVLINHKFKPKNRWSDYHMNITALLDQAQIPPPHSPWHVLPPTFRTTAMTTNFSTNTGRVSPFFDGRTRYRSMLVDARRYIEEDGLSLKWSETKERFYIIRNGTLLKISNQHGKYDDWRREIEDLMQSALDIGKSIMTTRKSRQLKFFFPRLNRRKRHTDQLVQINDNYSKDSGITMSEHHYELLRWLLGSTHRSDVSQSEATPKNIPIIVNKEDFKGCHGNDTKYYIPSLTFAMESAMHAANMSKFISNNYTNCIPFALPCYEMWNHVKSGLKFSPNDWYINKRKNPQPGYGQWDIHLDLNHQKYPWSNKISKVLWRGSSTGGRPSEGDSWKDLPRFQLVRLGLSHNDTMAFGFHKLNQGWELEPYRSDIQSQLPGCIKGELKFTDFMRYKAVLDINGNSWSSRFGHLMCLNSVVLKVEANDFINYFESSNELMPWKHYIPVEKDLSNLVEVSRYVLDPQNENEMLSIIANANEWCQHKMTVTQFAIDTLWMILNYVDLLYFHPTKKGNEENYIDSSRYREYHPLNFDWMEQHVYQLHNWTRARGNAKSCFESKLVKAHNESAFLY